MTRCYYLLFIFTFLVSCQQNKNENPIENYTEINLSFKDYNPSQHKSFIDLKVVNALNPIEEQIKISDNGTISYNFINKKKREIVFNYDNSAFSLIISPNEKINAELNIDNVINRITKPKALKINTGENKQTNYLLLSNAFFVDSLINSSTSSFSSQTKLSDIAYKNQRISEMHNQLNAFDMFVKKNDIENTQFINWSNAQIRYMAGYDLSLYPFMGKTNKQIDANNAYFDFVNEVRQNHEDELIYHSHLKYLKTLSTSFKIMSNVANNYSEEREQLKKDSLSNFPIVFKLLKRQAKNWERELLMAYLYQSSDQIPKKYQDSLEYVVNDQLLTQIKSTKPKNKTSDIYMLLKNYELQENEKAELLKLYNNAKGKVVYHDFWFTNCPPCMKELPNYNELIEKIKNQNVEFIFFGAYMGTDEWKATIENLNIKGKHHLLTKNQLAFFEKYFDLHSFPHHHLLKSNGEIGEKFKYSVRPKNFDRIIRLIKQHQVTKNINTQ